MNETAQAFVDCINAHDVDGLAALMRDGHVFIDAHGNKVRGKEAITAGWHGYFEWFADYRIEVFEVFENEETLGIFGFAGGSFKGNENAKMAFAGGLEGDCEQRSGSALTGLCRHQDSV